MLSYPYFDGVTNNKILSYCVACDPSSDEYYDYLCLLSKYWQKNMICIKKGMTSRYSAWRRNETPLMAAVRKNRGLKWFELIFDLYAKVDAMPNKEEFQEVFDKDMGFNGLSKECKSILHEKYNEFHPNEVK